MEPVGSRRKRRTSSEARKKAAERRTRRGAARAYAAAAELGPFQPVEAASYDVDGFPQLGRGQVYGFEAGLVYHPEPCSIVMHRWDSVPDSVKVLDEAAVGLRKMCEICGETAV